MAVAFEPIVKPRISTGGGGGGHLRRYDGRGGGGGGGGGGDDGGHQPLRDLGPAGVWVAIVVIITFFGSFCGAYVLRRSLAGDWRPLNLPPILWANTAMLIASSIAIEKARGRLRQGMLYSFNRWWGIGTGLGVSFLFGQWIGWMELQHAGISMMSNPSGSFFYLLTAAHAIHLLGGELALVYVGVRGASRTNFTAAVSSVNSARIYWHFMAVLWILLFVMLSVWR